MRALQIRRVTTPRASLTGLIAMAIDRYGVNGDQRPHAHPAAAPPARRGRIIGLTGSTPGISAPRMRPRVWCVLAARPARTTTRAPARLPGLPPPHMSGALLSGPPRTPPAKCRHLLIRQSSPPTPLSGILGTAAPPAEAPGLSGGTSGRHWATSAGSLRVYRRLPGQCLWASWTPRPTCGVCVTTPLPRCPNGVRDH